MFFGCLGILLWFCGTFVLPGVFFGSCVDINDDLELDMTLSVLIGFIGMTTLSVSTFASDEDDLKLPIFTISAAVMLVIYSIIALLIIGFGEIGPFPSQQLAKKTLIYIIYLVLAIIADILVSKGIIQGITTQTVTKKW